MKTLSVLLSLLLTVSSSADELKVTYHVADEKITLELTTRRLELGKRKLSYQPVDGGGRMLLLDGVEVVGTDLMYPSEKTEEFSLFRVNWNGQDLPVDPKLFSGFLNPNLKTELLDSGYAPLKIIVDPLGQWVQLLMFGADGGGSYQVSWLLRKNGKHSLCDPKVFEFSN